MEYDYTDINSIYCYAKELEGKKFKDIGTNENYVRNIKGGLGQFLEEEYFGYEVNSRAEADFIEAGVELKVTPFKRNKNKTISAKERLVLNIINYMEEVNNSFEESSFWRKNSKILMVFYEWLKDVKREEYEITKTILYQFPEEDLEIIKDDWETIVSKIRSGQAHTLSESDTMYLGACTKGVNKSSVREQPCSEEPAMQRAYSLKQSYMTFLLRNYVFGDKKSERIIQNKSELKDTTLEQYILNKLEDYYGQSIDELMKQYNIKGNPKQKVQMVASKILGLTDKLGKTEEFQKANIKVKSIRVEKNGSINESMSFPSFKFKKLLQETWETSELRQMFEQTKFLFFIVEKNKTGEYILNKTIFWNMPVSILDGPVKETWEETVRVLKEGVKLKPSGNKVFNNLPGSKLNSVCHVRPHTSKASYEPHNPNSDELPDGKWMTKQCFWLDKKFITQIILDNS
ncbi:Sau3AI family type II restriction endonuclease [Haloplasma contractile]|uniref:Sau3AI protein n=1 Tax=Haloplasma contractile SSD-17B TaxID=1033810 RepID=U2DTX3_9MOLU|nr:Sau3AI family type II restriction endonuclease [Haloplasma contractile]ERJ11907.1 Sau3AI protein [Haloplasma contractile SSD-17B]